MFLPSNNAIRRRLPLAFTSALFFVLAFHSPSPAGDFRVSPVMLHFDSDTKSGVIKLINEGGEGLRLQLGAFEWTQDAEGKDVYAETGDVVFFPKIMVVEPKSERVIRVGRTLPAGEKEKTYRLFVEEIPRRAESEGVRVTIAVRFGVPLFVQPAKEEPRGEIAEAGLSGGELGLLVRNTGNVHFMIQSIDISGRNADGEEKFSEQIAGWYLLGGASRRYGATIPEEVCAGLSTLQVTVKTDRLAIETKVDVDKAKCSR